MLALQRPEAVLPLEPRIDRAVVKGGLRIQIKLRGPPGRRAVLEFHPVGVEVVSRALGSKRREIFDLKVSRFLEVVVISHKIGIFLRSQRLNQNAGKAKKSSEKQQTKPGQADLLANELQQPIKTNLVRY